MTIVTDLQTALIVADAYGYPVELWLTLDAHVVCESRAEVQEHFPAVIANSPTAEIGIHR